MFKTFFRVLAAAVLVMAPVLAAHAGNAGTGGAVPIELVTVGDTNNAADPTVMATDATSGYGSVGYDYSIGAFDVTVLQYAVFLNAVARQDQYGLYNVAMTGDAHTAGIIRSGTYGSYTYTIVGSGSNPMTYVSWLDAARFCNWLQNGEPTSGGEAVNTTEGGVYTLDGDMTSGAETKAAGVNWWLPEENEWYKAAYYNPTLSASGGYYTFPTQSNTEPGNVYLTPLVANEANFINDGGDYAVTQSPVDSGSQNYLTPVGYFADSPGYYMTYDQGGDVYQWNDAEFSGTARGVRGGGWDTHAGTLQSNDRESRAPTALSPDVGFRVASALIPFPEISSTLSVTATDGIPFSYTITASNTPTSFNATSRPPGLGISGSTGVISGTPTQTGNYSTILSAINLGGTGTAQLSIMVEPIAAPMISSTLSVTGTDLVAFNYQITATNNPTSYTASGLPAGLALDGSSGMISGTLTQSGSFPAMVSSTISAINMGGTDTETLAIDILAPPPPMISSTLSATGTDEEAFEYQIEANYRPTSYSEMDLPMGLILDGSTGLISGTPTVTGTFSPTITAISASGSDTETLSLTILPPKPMITSPLTATGTNGGAFSYQIMASGSISNFSASNLPPGLTVDTGVGIISGTLHQGGVIPITISASNAQGTGTATLILSVSTSFSGLGGAYDGLVSVDGTNEGIFTLSLTSARGFTGKVTVPGISYSLTGTFNAFGTYGSIKTQGQATLDELLNVNELASQVFGTITAATGQGVTTYTVKCTPLRTYTAATLPAGLAGYYTVMMPAVSASNTAVPNAPGYGEMVVSQAGLISISGKLGDGTAFGTMAQLHADGKTWTLYTPLYGGLTPGGIAGTMTFENLAGSDCDGSLEWIKHPQTSSGIYSSGFAVGATLDAAKYAAAPSLTPGTTGTIAFANGDLLFGPFADNLSISAAQKITVDAAGTVVLFNPANGAFGGWFPYPGTDAKTYFNGIFYKKPAAEGVGLFLGSSQSGSVEITPP